MYYIVNFEELANPYSKLVTIIASSSDPVKLNNRKSDNDVIISADLLYEMGKFGWEES